MTRAEILQRFRDENPEITTIVVADSVLNSWLEQGNLEVCIRARLIKKIASFTVSTGVRTYAIPAQIADFYDIDELPGGGVAYDDDRLKITSAAKLDDCKPSWRTVANGTPKEYFRHNDDIILDVPPDNDTSTIEIYYIAVPDAFNNDDLEPYNELAYLRSWDYTLVLYLQKRVFAGVIAKPEKYQAAAQEYEQYVQWMKREVNRGIYAPIQYKPPRHYRGVSRDNY